MAKSSINFQKASGHSTDHNFRKDKPNYLLPKEFQKENEFWQHEKSEQQIFDDELSKAKRKGGRKPKFENSRWEAVLNLNANHGLEDVKKVAEHIEKEFNVTCSAIAIHRDEGFVENDKPQYNYHAHINFVTYKDGKQNWRKEHIKPQMLSELQTKVAELLEMERGEVGSKAVRLEHRQHREVKKREAKELAKQKDLKAEIKRLRAELKEQGAVREQYAQLEQLNRDLKEQIKLKDLTIDELKEKLQAPILGASTDDNKLKQLADKAAELIEAEKTAHKETQKELSEARETILKQKATIDSQKQRIELLEQNISDLKAKVEELESELKLYRGRDRQEKRREVNEAKKALKSEEAELSSIISTERSEINIAEVEQFIEDSTGADRRKAKKYLSLRKDFEKFGKYKDRPELLEAEDINLEELEAELLEAEQKLLEAGFEPREKNQAQVFNEIMAQMNDENDIENDSFLAP